MRKLPTRGQVVKVRGPYEEGPWIPAKVIDLLSSQFTVQYMNGTGTLGFRFYTDCNVTWEE